MFPFRDESHLLLTSDLQSDYLEARSASSRPTFAPVHRNEFTAFDLFIQRTTAHSCRVCVGVRKLRPVSLLLCDWLQVCSLM